MNNPQYKYFILKNIKIENTINNVFFFKKPIRSILNIGTFVFIKENTLHSIDYFEVQIVAKNTFSAKNKDVASIQKLIESGREIRLYEIVNLDKEKDWILYFDFPK